MAKKIIDTHVHVWDLEKAAYPWLAGDTSVLNQTWKIEQVEEERKKAGVTSGVLVQASGNLEDTELMLETARRTEWIEGVVVWLPLMDPGKLQELIDNKFLEEEYFKGVRHQVHDEKDAGWLLQEPVIESLKILAAYDIPYDVVTVLPQQMRTVLEVANKVPRLRMVLDHLSQPPISKKEKYGEWGQLMETAAKHSNFYAKISGLGTASGDFANRKQEDIEPYIEFVLKNFGAGRCFCGGDWPVSVLAGSYSDIWTIYKNVLSASLSEEDLKKVLSANAETFYGL